ncbi:MAG TPA: methyltransferase domain-containing protein [Rhizomicrobium sp.]|nr:methyltransferase domain-containing protein [Rhizomicrobium sp.]
MTHTHDEKAVWTSYWHGGRQACFSGNEVSRQALTSLWRNFFSGFDEGARLLDLATGAGEVAMIAADVGAARGLDFEISGVDFAAIAPSQRRGVTLLGDTDISALPFASATFGGITSQFGFEYAQGTDAIGEAARVMAPAAKGLFVIHHAQSLLSIQTRSRLRTFDAIAGDMGAFDKAQESFALFARNAPQAKTLAAVTRFRQAVQAMRNALSLSPDAEPNTAEAVSFLSDLARSPHTFDPVDAGKRVQAARRDIDLWKKRQMAQIAAAKDAASMQRLAGEFGASGLTVAAPAELRDASGTLLAWTFEFRKP